MSTRTTIIIDVKTRNILKNIGRKEQTYDDIIKELIDKKNNVPNTQISNLTGVT
ncbi:MAG: hypothetical protein L0H53_10330 [Candidatus Nitrosocosmicus sp.]|nr:hypothetical protein [Candidatus Nitrosocosmicus sp.]